MNARRRCARHARQRGVHDVRSTGKGRATEQFGKTSHPNNFVLRNTPKHRGGSAPRRIDNDEIPETFEHVFDETARVVTGLNHAVNRRKGVGGVRSADRFDAFVEKFARRVAEEVVGSLACDDPVVRTRNDLVEQRERVAHRTPAGPDDEGQDAVLDGDLFLDTQFGDIVEHDRGGNQPERIVVGARTNCPNHFFGFGRRKNELDVFWRFFHDFEQRIEPLLGDHVGFIEDENLVPIPRGCEPGSLAQFTGVIDSVVACGIDFDDVERPRPVSGQFDTTVALSARCIGGTLGTVEAPCEDSSGRRLSATAGSGK